MAGHSKWAQIKHKKAISDAKKSAIFSKLAALITVASREGGGNPDANPKLRMAIEKARSMNMPHENIMRAIKRGTGELPGSVIEEIIWEAYGPGGVALLIEGFTDNKNRTTAELRHILEEHGGKLAESGSVKWQFKETGRISVPDNVWQDDLAVELIDAGAEDLKHEDGKWSAYAPLELLENLKTICAKRGIIDMEVEKDFLPQNPINVGEPVRSSLLELFESLDEHPDVKEIYSNATTSR